MQAGQLRNRVTIQRRELIQNEVGEVEIYYADLYIDIAAAVEPISGREFFAASQIQGTVDTRIRIRWHRGIDETMRVVHVTAYDSPEEVDVYDIVVPLDQRSQRRELHLMCLKRSADGFQKDGNTVAPTPPTPGSVTADSTTNTADQTTWSADNG